MDILPISQQPLTSLSGIDAVTAIDTLAIEQTLGAASPAISPTTVDLSPLGRFLSAASLFQKKVLELQATAVKNGDVPDKDAIAAAASALADAFSQLQASGIDNSGDATLAAPDNPSFAGLFAQQFGAQTGPADDSAPATQASLAAIGLNFNPAAASDQVDSLTIDQPTLQASLSADPAATAALLGQAVQAFATLAGVVPETAAAPTALPDSAAPLVSEPAQPNHEDIFLQQLLHDSTPAPASAAADDVFVSEAQFLSFPPAPAASAPTADTFASALPASATSAPVVAAASNPLAIDPAIASIVNQTLTAQALEARTAAIAADNKAQAARGQERADIDAQETVRADQLRAANNATALQGARAPESATNTVTAAVPLSVPESVTPAVPAQVAVPVLATDDTVAATVQPPLQPDQAQQLARDPSIAAAIAAYNLNTGPFASLNGRPELAAPAIKTIAPVATVAKVTAIDIDGASKGSTRGFR